MEKPKVLFIDRDGTIIVEPPSDFQVDSLEKLAFLPEAISYLRKISEELDFELVMVTNQDGLGTDSFPEETFWPAHQKMLDILEGENIHFKEILIDRSFEYENKETRKPGTGMLRHYMNSDYDLANSFVIGDRETDMQLAKNLGCQGILLSNKNSENASSTVKGWKEIYDLLAFPPRKASITRNTNETRISIELNLDGQGNTGITTGIAFFDHMLDQLGKHGSMDLNIKVDGDLEVDEHHTIEDTALALGECFLNALGDKKGISRYGFLLPMDDCLAQVAIDFGGRPWLMWEAGFKREKIGEMPTEMFYHFFKSFSDTSRSNLNIKAEGKNEHHKIEAIFKAWARAIKMAVKRNPAEKDKLPSTKGTL
jgi:imidazoleglycerol-phosphate dehydratase/histidinol-phosphatase